MGIIQVHNRNQKLLKMEAEIMQLLYFSWKHSFLNDTTLKGQQYKEDIFLVWVWWKGFLNKIDLCKFQAKSMNRISEVYSSFMKGGKNPVYHRKKRKLYDARVYWWSYLQLSALLDGVLIEAGKLGTAVIPHCITSITVSSFLLIINVNALLAFTSK